MSLSLNRDFHRAVRSQVDALVDRYGAEKAYAEARRRRLALPKGPTRTFAYGVELIAAEVAGVSTDNPKAKPLGPEGPYWFLPFVSQDLVDRMQLFWGRLADRMGLPSAPDPTPLAAAFTTGEAGPSPLTERQLECLRWAAQGKSSWDIAAIVGLSPRTVDEHLDNACRRLGVKRRTQAAIIAVRDGLL